MICEEIDLCDADFHRRALGLLEHGDADMVVGSKAMKGASDERPLFRRAATRVINGMLRVALDFRGTDTHGLKAFHRDRAARRSSTLRHRPRSVRERARHPRRPRGASTARDPDPARREAAAGDQPVEARAERAARAGEPDLRDPVRRKRRCARHRGRGAGVRRSRSISTGSPATTGSTGSAPHRRRARDVILRARAAARAELFARARHPRHLVRGRPRTSTSRARPQARGDPRRLRASSRAPATSSATTRYSHPYELARSPRERRARDRPRPRVLRRAPARGPRLSRARLRRLARDARRARAPRLSLRLVDLPGAGLLRGEGGRDGALALARRPSGAVLTNPRALLAPPALPARDDRTVAARAGAARRAADRGHAVLRCRRSARRCWSRPRRCAAAGRRDGRRDRSSTSSSTASTSPTPRRTASRASSSPASPTCACRRATARRPRGGARSGAGRLPHGAAGRSGRALGRGAVTRSWSAIAKPNGLPAGPRRGPH